MEPPHDFQLQTCFTSWGSTPLAASLALRTFLSSDLHLLLAFHIPSPANCLLASLSCDTKILYPWDWGIHFRNLENLEQNVLWGNTNYCTFCLYLSPLFHLCTAFPQYFIIYLTAVLLPTDDWCVTATKVVHYELHKSYQLITNYL